MLVSIVIPVYNGAEYLARTTKALEDQTLGDFEVILVDDSSTDESATMLRDLALRDDRIRILSTRANLGSAPKAVNFALPHVRGDFFVYASQDDFFSEDWLENMHARAHETGADAVIPNLVFYTGHDDDRTIVGLHGDRSTILSGREAVRWSLDWTIAGNALWRTDLVRNAGYDDFSMNADEFSVRKFFHCCERVAFSAGTFFYNQTNPRAVTKATHPRLFDYAYTSLHLYRFLEAEGYPQDIYAGELLRAASTLISVRQRFGFPLAPEARQTVQASLDLLRQPDTRALLRAQRGPRSILIAQSTTRGKLVFTAIAMATAPFTRFRKYLTSRRA